MQNSHLTGGPLLLFASWHNLILLHTLSLILTCLSKSLTTSRWRTSLRASSAPLCSLSPNGIPHCLQISRPCTQESESKLVSVNRMWLDQNKRKSLASHGLRERFSPLYTFWVNKAVKCPECCFVTEKKASLKSKSTYQLKLLKTEKENKKQILDNHLDLKFMIQPGSLARQKNQPDE